MDTMHLDNNKKGVEDELAEQLPSSCSFLDEIFGDPQLTPRVGNEYQAEIPHLVGECHSLQVVNRPVNSEVINNVPNPSPLGLPIPLFWTKTEAKITNGAFEFENSKESLLGFSHGCTEYKVQILDSVLDDRKEVGGYAKLQPATGTDQIQEPKSKLKQVDTGPFPLPGTSGEVWKDIELDSFLLGLYIFGKNLILVKKFVESKGMGEILSFYYGKFYRSDGYRRWSECRKLRGRRCIHGQKLFTGWRQQEFLSRLSSHLSKECQDMLLEVSKIFGEGKISFEEYIFTLKTAVGLDKLIEAIGIGKGKHDLTANAMETLKANHVASFRPEIPVGKACSSLSSAEIIKFLTGDFRLSKARSSDLFWEAVWPRLLARGWHSEQPKDQVFSGSKNCLVFLIPGVKKFSRRRLVKGNHYFDSVTDVLNKVASEPELIELEIEENKGSKEKEEDKWDMKQDPEVLGNKRNRYLKPRNSVGNQNLMKFTIVDTSLVQGIEQSKVRELRTLPLEAASLSTPSSSSSDSEESISDDREDETEGTSTSNSAEAMADRGECVDLSECVNSNSNIAIPRTSDITIVSLENHESHNMSLLNEEEQKVMDYNFRGKDQSSNSKYLAPVCKQRGLTDCTNEESSCSAENVSEDRMLNGDISHCWSNSSQACEDMCFQNGSQNLSPASSLARGGPDERKEGVVMRKCQQREESSSKTQSHTLIDLNVPQVSMDLEIDEPFVIDKVQNSDNSGAHMLHIQSETMQPEPLRLPDNCAEVNQQPNMQNRRQSTRNRPLTTKALEAIECGFLTPKRKNRAAEVPQNNSKRKKRTAEVPQNNSQRVCTRPVVSSIFRNGASNSNLKEK